MKRLRLLPLLLASSVACSSAPGDVTTTEYVYVNPFPTGWAASAPVTESGEIPLNVWFPVGRNVTLYKTSDASRLKVTVSDNLRVGLNTNGGNGYFEVRMNGGTMAPRCYQRKYHWNAPGFATGNFHNPFATVCVTDVLPKGLYDFDVWLLSSAGTSYVGANAGQPVVLVEELPADDSFAVTPPPAGAFYFTNGTSAYAQAPGRQVAYTKKSADSLLKVTLADTLRVGYNVNGGSGTVMIRMDGADTDCNTGQYDAQGTGGDFHEPFVMTCVFASVSAAEHTFDVWLRSGTGGAAAGEAALGWERSRPLLLVEELPAAGRSIANGSAVSGELAGAWAGVGSRSLTHVVGAAGNTVKLTYSDTFRGAANTNGVWGYLKVYLDNQPTTCSAAQLSLESAVQDHHRPINLTCLFPDLTPGPHTFSIWSTAPSGSNYFGWNRGQNLLLAEDLP